MLKKIFLFLALTGCFFLVSGQNIQWTWLQGEAYTPGYGRYGTKGLADPSNRPGSRSGTIYWLDSAGKMWLFGGNGVSVNGTGFLNDLWRYDPAGNTWTWINGEFLVNPKGVYKQQGVTSPGNSVMPRSFAQKWIDAQGNLWVYGGIGPLPLTIPVNAPLNDLWKYTPSSNTWTWMMGDTIWDYRLVNIALPVRYGTQGVEAASNKPPSKNQALNWSDSAGNLWLYGGLPIPTATSRDLMSDLWRYSIATGLWTWMGGDTTTFHAPRYGTIGQASPLNKPGDRTRSTTWTDKQGNLWLFGGMTQKDGYTQIGNLKNDLWMYAPATRLWTWMGGDTLNNPTGIYGTKGIASANNRPGGRCGMLQWTDTAGRWWFFSGADPTAANLVYSDFWMYDPVSKAWTWIAGDSTASGSRVVYGSKGIASDTTYPPSTSTPGLPTGTDANNNLWFAYNDFYWSYSPASNRWTWVRGDTVPRPLLQAPAPSILPVWGNKGVPAGSNSPGARKDGTSWTDLAGNLWLYSGQRVIAASLNSTTSSDDLWKYEPANNGWTWVGGDSLGSISPKFGIQNMPSDSATPGSRVSLQSWTAADGTLWLFGGSTRLGFMNDVWKFNPGDHKWTWVRGGAGVYGVYPSASNIDPMAYTPGSRIEAASWKDSNGNFWLFGGQGNARSPSPYNPTSYFDMQGKVNDLWRFSPDSGKWTCLKGNGLIANDGTSSSGYYGTKGVAGPANLPLGRSGTAYCADGSGNLWLFGGITDIAPNYELRQTYLNDLWKYTPSSNQWTWMSGDNTFMATASYGTLGVPSPTNKPGYRKHATMWSDGGDNLYLFGGNMDTLTSYPYPSRYLNDLWRYNIPTGLWTWLGGSDKFNWPGTYGTLGVPSAANQPGGRDGSYYWTDSGNNLWVYGGYGNAVNGQRYLNDMMKLSFGTALPVRFSQFSARKQGDAVALSWTTAQEQNSAEFQIERSADAITYTRIGSVAAAGTAPLSTSYTFIDHAPFDSDNFYRIKELDRDGKSMYSSVQKVAFGNASWAFSILTNPVRQQLTLSLLLPTEQVLQLQVRDAAGRLLVSRQASAPKGTSQLPVDVARLRAGTYFLQIRSGNYHGTKAFVKH